MHQGAPTAFLLAPPERPEYPLVSPVIRAQRREHVVAAGLDAVNVDDQVVPASGRRSASS